MKKLLVALMLLRALSSFAQQATTAELIGTVTSAGQQLPGVTITLTASSLQGNRVTVTGQNGGYRIGLLPPGDYLVRADLEGFTATQKRVPLSLAANTRLDLVLQPASLHETITVNSDDARAPSDAAIITDLRVSDLRRLPGARDIRAAVLLSPSANALGTGNRLLIAGAPSWDSVFLVDGVVANEYLTGQPHDIVVEDAVQEVVLLAGAISAEYGRFTGGTVSTLTKSGGNEFSGSVRDTMTNGAWTNQTPWPSQSDPLDRINHAAEATLGGFLLKDRFWFFAAGRKTESTLGSFTALTNIPYQAGSRDERWQAKITNQISVRHSLVASYAGSSLVESNIFNSRTARSLDLASLIPVRRQPTRLLALTYTGVLGSNSAAEIHASTKRYALQGNGGRSRDRIAGTLIQTGGNGNMNAPLGCGICGDDERDSRSWSVKNSHYHNSRWGNHTLIIGADSFHEQRRNDGTRSSSEFNVQTGPARTVGANAYPRFDATTLIVWSPPHPSHETDMNASSGYLNDRWDLSHLSVNLGVRYDRNNAKDALGHRISDDAALSPRLSATFDLGNDGRHRLFASYGRYGAKILDGGGSGQQIGIFDQFGWRYGGPEINAITTPVNQLVASPEALARLFAWFDSVRGIQNRQYLQFITNPDSDSQFHGSLRSPAVDEWSLGYALQLHRGFVRADYISRDWRHFYAMRVDTTTGQQIDPLGNKLDVAWVINDDLETVRQYRAIQFQGSWRYGRASVGGGYVWSKLQGNDEAEEGTTGSAPRNRPLELYYPEFLGYPQRRPIGYLKQDQRHRARVWVGYETSLPNGSLSAFAVQWFDSGRAYSAVADIDPGGLIIPYEGAPAIPSSYSLNQVKRGPYFFSVRGAFRTDDSFSTDIALNYEVPVHAVRLFVKTDVLNLFNNNAVVSPDTLVTTRLSGGPASRLAPFNPFTQVPVEGVNYRLSPTFGQATGPASYQTPRTFQVAVGARF
ncbi:MAG TPA: carboxypeptidase regulatory-like domain-containing protein [Thermoanaerobaculia bacterium]|nr:carboxypeptidase regulatory-like domain-containing protein [Thermoanaerobaculia bacterium]